MAPPALSDPLGDLSESLSAHARRRAQMLSLARPTACVEVSSLDAAAAARAAAILKVHHHYIHEGSVALESEATASALYPALPTAGESSANRSASLAELLDDAEEGLRIAAQRARPPSAAGSPQTPRPPGAFTPASARAPRITAHALRPQAQAGRWTREAWAHLDQHLHAYIREQVAQQPVAGERSSAAAAALDVDATEVIMRFLDAEGLEPEDLSGAWRLPHLFARIPALQARFLRMLNSMDTGDAAWEQLADRSCQALEPSPEARAVHSTPVAARVARTAPAENSALSVALSEEPGDATDQLYAPDELPRKRARVDNAAGEAPETSLIGRLWRGMWGRREAGSEEPSAARTGAAAGEASSSSADATSGAARRSAAAGGGISRGSSFIENTAFSTLGEDAQRQAAVLSAHFARLHAGDGWRSPRRTRLQAMRRVPPAGLAVPADVNESRRMWVQQAAKDAS